MCNYQIETSLIHDRSDSCMLPKIWNEWINKTFMDEQAQQHLATDEDGMCVFHSKHEEFKRCLLYTSPSPRDGLLSRMPSSA